MNFWGQGGVQGRFEFLGSGWGPKTVLESTHVVLEQLRFFIVPSILTFDFELILGSFWTFWGPNGLFGFNICFGSPHID